MTFDYVRYKRSGDVVIISMADEATLNAISFTMVEELRSALTAAEREAKAILLTGAGRGFCSGANLANEIHGGEGEYDAGTALDTHYNPLMLQLRALEVPLVTAVNGPAAGIGAAIGLAGDIILAAERAYFLQAFQRVGLVPDGGSAFLLVHAAGRARAMEMMLLGERVSARQALEWGMINRVVADEALHAESLALAQRLASGPTKALAMTKRLGWMATETSFENLLAEERKLQRVAGLTSDHREGIEAFRTKRPPIFTGS